jgi:Uncharacterized conserved protein
LILVGIIGALVVYKTTDTLRPANVQPQKKAALIDGIRQVKIDSGPVDVQVVPSNSRSLSAELQGWGNAEIKRSIQLNVKKEGSSLNIIAERKVPFFGITYGWVKLVVTVPDQLYDSIRVQTASGDLTVHSLKAKQLTLTAQSGDIDAESNQGDHLSLQASSGNVTARDNRVSSDAVVASDSGDAVNRLSAESSSRLETKSGDLTVQNIKGALTALADSGDIQIKNDSLTGAISAETSSGDLNLHFAKAPTSLSLDYASSSGDGTVRLSGMVYDEKSDHVIRGKIGGGEYQIKARTSSGDFSLK